MILQDSLFFLKSKKEDSEVSGFLLRALIFKLNIHLSVLTDSTASWECISSGLSSHSCQVCNNTVRSGGTVSPLTLPNRNEVLICWPDGHRSRKKRAKLNQPDGKQKESRKGDSMFYIYRMYLKAEESPLSWELDAEKDNLKFIQCQSLYFFFFFLM